MRKERQTDCQILAGGKLSQPDFTVPEQILILWEDFLWAAHGFQQKSEGPAILPHFDNNVHYFCTQ